MSLKVPYTIEKGVQSGKRTNIKLLDEVCLERAQKNTEPELMENDRMDRKLLIDLIVKIQEKVEIHDHILRELKIKDRHLEGNQIRGGFMREMKELALWHERPMIVLETIEQILLEGIWNCDQVVDYLVNEIHSFTHHEESQVRLKITEIFEIMQMQGECDIDTNQGELCSWIESLMEDKNLQVKKLAKILDKGIGEDRSTTLKRIAKVKRDKDARMRLV